MANQLVGIDQAVVAVRDLEVARATYERLGFRPMPLGRHLGLGTANHCLMFPSDYVVLLGIADPGKFTGGLEQQLADREGLWSVGLGSHDPAATRAAWAAAGLGPAEVGRHTMSLEGGVELGFQNVMLDPLSTGGVRLFGCRPADRAALHQPAWQAHPNGAHGIASITIAVDEPAAYVEPMAKVFGTTSLTETDDTLAVHTGSGVLMFATADDLDMLHPELEGIATAGKAVIAALSLRVRHLDAAAAWLEQAAIPHRRAADGTVGIPPAETHGVMLEFVGT
jgi:hypothetical protein